MRRRLGPGAGALLVVLVTVYVLGGVAFNRRPPAEATVRLTEREAHLGWQQEEDTGLALTLEWRYGGSDDSHAWLDQAKLREFGFDFPIPLDDPRAETRYQDLLPRRAYALLEIEGDAWQAHLARQQKDLDEMRDDIQRGKAAPDGERRLLTSQADDRLNGSRLFLIDVGRDAAALRRDHPDRSRFIVTPALVRAYYEKQAWQSGKPVPGCPCIVGSAQLLSTSIHVPRVRRAVLDQVRHDDQARHLEWPSTRPPAYEVVVRFGRRLEPWVERIDRLPGAETGASPAVSR